MAQVADLSSTDIDQYLKQHEGKSLLRFITCGSVDDGKSTLIGRLVDGLAAECEQGISIDVGYRFFSTDKRKFIVANTPGHEQYTRDIVTGASTADAAILMVDARKGILTQARRHSYLVSLLGIRHLVVAINKMDLVGYSEKIYQQIVDDYRQYAKQIGLEEVTFIPLSAFTGDNITEPSVETPWYSGPTLMGYLETVEVDDEHLQKLPMRMAVQWVNRPNLDFRGFSGYLASGRVKPGDKIRVLPSGKESRVARIVADGGDLQQAVAGQSITLTMEDEIDISRGDLLMAASAPASVGRQFETTLIWMHDEPLLPGRSYLMKIGTRTVPATVTDIKYQVNVNTLEHMAAKHLALNGIGVCTLSLDQNIAFDAYQDNRDTGSFILIDRMTNTRIGAGLINFALRRSQNITVQHLDVDKQARQQMKHQKPCVLWLTGLSGSGKSTIANLVEKKLFALGRHTYLLDGDNVRHGLNKDLGFTDADRVENIRRIAEVAHLMVDAGLIVISAFISPFRAERDMARRLLEEGEFCEVYVDTPLDIAEQRDVKGLYKKARKGELKNFTGIDSPYEVPEAPECVLDTTAMSADEAADKVLEMIKARGYI